MQEFCTVCKINYPMPNRKKCLGCVKDNKRLCPATPALCYSCKKPGARNARKFSFCSGCWKTNFVRSSGTEREGIDFTRQIVRIRDRHTCQEEHGGCGRIWQIGERRFDIHHLDGLCGLLSRSYDKVETMDRLITLCHKCHLNLPEVKDKMRNRTSPRPEEHKKYQKEWVKNNLR